MTPLLILKVYTRRTGEDGLLQAEMTGVSVSR
jgi:hypothetical protein